MDLRDDALAGAEDRDPADFHQEGKEGDEQFVPPKDGSWVPRGRLNAALVVNKQLEERLTRLEQQVTPPQRQVTRTELQALVQRGEITSAEAEQRWEQQLADSVAERVEARVTARSRSDDLRQTIGEYERVIPALQDDNSPEFQKVASEYRYLLSDLGMPDNAATMVVATRNVFGPLNALKVKGAERARGDALPDGGGGLGTKPDAGGDSNDKNPARWDRLTQDQQDFYQKQIDMGQYKDRADVLKMIGRYQARPTAKKPRR